MIDTYGQVLNVRPRVIWNVPNDSEGQGLHFHIYLDTTDASTLVADSAIAAQRSYFEWYNGSSWVALPGDGVSAGSGQIRYTPQADLTTDDDHFYIIGVHDGTTAGPPSSSQRFIVAASSWTDVLTAGSPIRAIHLTELRDEANRSRNAYSLSDISWTDATITPGLTPIRSIHFTELRSSVTDVRDLTGTSVTIGASSVSAGSPISTGPISELRTAIDGL